MRLAIFTGPSGGHFYPALAFVEVFKKRHPEAQILFVTGARGRFLAEKVRGQIEAEFEFLPDFPFPRPRGPDFVFQIFPFLFKFVQAFLKAEKLLNDFKPHLSVGFGSYLAFPGVVASARRKIPTLIHEQNRKMGRANAWLVRLADRIALSFEPTKAPPPSRLGVLTGLPLRGSLLERAAQRRRAPPPFFSNDRLRVLLLGGSQGSQSLNRLWTRAIQLLSDEEKSKIAVIHITGERNFAPLEKMYLSTGMEALVFPFHERMEEIYPEADLAIARAGASTLFELALFALPAVVLPYPHADRHQEENARYFEKERGILLLSEKESNPLRLKEEVLKLISSSTLRGHLSENLRRLARPDASERLVEVAEELLTTASLTSLIT